MHRVAASTANTARTRVRKRAGVVSIGPQGHLPEKNARGMQEGRGGESSSREIPLPIPTADVPPPHEPDTDDMMQAFGVPRFRPEEDLDDETLPLLNKEVRAQLINEYISFLIFTWLVVNKHHAHM